MIGPRSTGLTLLAALLLAGCGGGKSDAWNDGHHIGAGIYEGTGATPPDPTSDCSARAPLRVALGIFPQSESHDFIDGCVAGEEGK